MARDGGFTLVEMLASLVILGMVSLLLVQGVQTSAPVWRRLDAEAASGTAVESAQTILRERLERAYPAARYDGIRPYADFTGSPQALDFSAPGPNGAAAGNLRYALRLSAGGDLLLSSRDHLAVGPGADRQVLLTRVQSIGLSYFGGGEGSPGVWRDRWQGEPTAPRLVRLQVVFQPGDRRVWPELIVRTAADTSVRCVGDVSGGGCGAAA